MTIPMLLYQGPVLAGLLIRAPAALPYATRRYVWCSPVLAPVIIRTSSRRFSGCDMLGGGIAYQGKASPVALPTEGELTMFTTICRTLRQRAAASLCAAGQRLLAWLKPATGTPVGGALGDLARTKAELLAENALLRQ